MKNGLSVSPNKTTKPIALEVKEHDIPHELKKDRKFLVWEYQGKSGQENMPDAWSKPPFDPVTGKAASPTNPENYSTFPKAMEAYLNGEYDGIGRMICPPYVGVDLDKCRDPETTNIEPWARKIVTELYSYTEVSLSGTGVKIWLKGELPKGGRRTKNIEMYDSGRYFTVTGHHLEGTPTTVEERQKELEAIYQETFGKKEPVSCRAAKESSPVLARQNEAEIIRKIISSKDKKLKKLWEGDWSGYKSQSEADLALCIKLAFLIGPDPKRIDALFRESGLYREKWEREDYRNRTIEKAISQLSRSNSMSRKEELENEQQNPIGSTASLNLSDLGNAERLAVLHGKDLRYCHAWKRWLVWEEKRWQIDQIGAVKAKAKDTVRKMYKEAERITDKDDRTALAKHALRSESDSKIRAMISLAQSEKGIPVEPDKLDKDPWLFNCQNGTIDLRTGEIRKHRRKNLLTKISPVTYDSDAICPAWEEHLGLILKANNANITFLKRAFGCSLTGDNSERSLFILYGKGRNGKTITIETIAEILGDYALLTPVETLLRKRTHTIPNDIAA